MSFILQVASQRAAIRLENLGANTELKGEFSDRSVTDRYVARIIVRLDSILPLWRQRPRPATNARRRGIIYLHHRASERTKLI
jgi:hypothetical protein